MTWSVAFTPACGKVLGVEDYSVAPPAATDGGDDLPPWPAVPDESRRAACQTCVATSCKDERKRCLGSASCKKMLACQGVCRDPSCLAKCADTLPRSYDFDDYFNCAYASGNSTASNAACSGDCGAGDNWDCRGNYSWEQVNGFRTVKVTPFDTAYDAYNTGRVLQTMPGVRIASCSDALLPSPLGEQGCSDGVPTNASGAASIRMGSTQSLFTITGGLDEYHRYYPRPLPRDADVTAYMIGAYPIRLLVKTFASSFAPKVFDPHLGILMFNQTDCLGAVGGANVGVDLEPRDPGVVAFMLPGSTAVPADLPFFHGVGFIINIQPRTQLHINGTGPDGKVWSTTTQPGTVLTAPGWITDVILYPQER